MTGKKIIVKLPKKGNLSDCNNWRGITLLNRVQNAVDQTLREEQAGFRKGRSCTEQIFALRNIIEQSLEHQKNLVINFIDFKKAFDSVHRPSLWKILKHYGIPARTSASLKHCTIIPAAVSRQPRDAQTSLI